MRLGFKTILILLLLWRFAPAQGTPPHDPQEQTHQFAGNAGTPPQAPTPRMEQMKNLIKTQVRVGLGAMPSFHRIDITDRELDDLVRYLKALRRQPTYGVR